MRGPFDRGGDGRPFKPGQSGNPEGSSKGRRGPKTEGERGRPPGERPSRVVLWDLQQAAKDKSRRGLEILEQCMEDTTCDWNTRLKAVELLFERAYGRPQVSVDMNMTHNFAEVPETMPLGLWLERKGQPVGASGDEWLRQQGAGGGGTSDAPSSQAGHSSGPPTIDLKAEPEPEDELPPARAKLN